MASSTSNTDRRQIPQTQRQDDARTPGWASLGMRHPSPRAEHPDMHTAQYGDDPRAELWERDRAHLRHFEHRHVTRPATNARPPRNYLRSDDRIRDDVADVLTDAPDVDATDIEFEVAGGIVTLSGYVPDRRMRFIAEERVARCRGVNDVVNNIRTQPWRERAVGHR